MPTEAQKQALVELEASFADHAVTHEETLDGNVVVWVADLPIGDQFEPPISTVAFVLSVYYPAADVYPHYVIANSRRVSGATGAGIGRVNWRSGEVLQVSRKSNRWNAALDTAAIKLSKVLAWLRTQ